MISRRPRSPESPSSLKPATGVRAISCLLMESRSESTRCCKSAKWRSSTPQPRKNPPYPSWTCAAAGWCRPGWPPGRADSGTGRQPCITSVRASNWSSSHGCGPGLGTARCSPTPRTAARSPAEGLGAGQTADGSSARSRHRCAGRRQPHRSAGIPRACGTGGAGGRVPAGSPPP